MPARPNIRHVAFPKKNVPDAKGKKNTNDIHIRLKVHDRQEEQVNIKGSKIHSEIKTEGTKAGPRAGKIHESPYAQKNMKRLRLPERKKPASRAGVTSSSRAQFRAGKNASSQRNPVRGKLGLRETYSDVRERALKSTGVNLGSEEETELTNFSMMTSFITNLQPDIRHLELRRNGIVQHDLTQLETIKLLLKLLKKNLKEREEVTVKYWEKIDKITECYRAELNEVMDRFDAESRKISEEFTMLHKCMLDPFSNKDVKELAFEKFFNRHKKQENKQTDDTSMDEEVAFVNYFDNHKKQENKQTDGRSIDEEVSVENYFDKHKKQINKQTDDRSIDEETENEVSEEEVWSCKELDPQEEGHGDNVPHIHVSLILTKEQEDKMTLTPQVKEQIEEMDHELTHSELNFMDDVMKEGDRDKVERIFCLNHLIEDSRLPNGKCSVCSSKNEDEYVSWISSCLLANRSHGLCGDDRDLINRLLFGILPNETDCKERHTCKTTNKRDFQPSQVNRPATSQFRH
ncbi:uncharacterized protein LOC110835266 isoform X2 [Zootermopsis nevadensis]|uniref:uncharacterized protein LOC110835266 isoform X2 n=1 Tax=Zootermopsis nevadensis TaxID=136037 RepID=UPI000B8EC1A8|nr:uncharacterized protein LOC110835266 isoform X2 [Zootermopsis nevadensis]